MKESEAVRTLDSVDVRSSELSNCHVRLGAEWLPSVNDPMLEHALHAGRERTDTYHPAVKWSSTGRMIELSHRANEVAPALPWCLLPSPRAAPRRSDGAAVLRGFLASLVRRCALHGAVASQCRERRAKLQGLSERARAEALERRERSPPRRCSAVKAPRGHPRRACCVARWGRIICFVLMRLHTQYP